MRTSKPTTVFATFVPMSEAQQIELHQVMFQHIAALVAEHFQEIENEQIRKHEVHGNLPNLTRHPDREVDPRSDVDRQKLG